jgi:CheY-like chemotaxis protein
MPQSPEQPYNLEQAQEEAAKLQEKIKSGEAKTYAEAEELVEKEKEPRPVRVVVDDDDPIVLEMARRAFGLVKQEGEKQEETERKERRRIELNTTTNPAEVLRMIESDNPPDIIFTDLIFEGKNEEIHERYLEYVNEVERLANIVSNIIQGDRIETVRIGKVFNSSDLFGELQKYYATIALPMVRSMRSGKTDLEHVYKALDVGEELEATRNNPEKRKKLVEEKIKEAEDFVRKQEEYLREEEQRCQQEGRDPNTDETVIGWRNYVEDARRSIDGLRRAFEIIERMEKGEEIDVKEEYPYGALIFQEAMKRKIDAKIVTDLGRHAIRSISKFTGKPVWEIGIITLPLVEQGFTEKGFGPIIQGTPRLLSADRYFNKKPSYDDIYPVTEERSINSWKGVMKESIGKVEEEREIEE